MSTTAPSKKRGTFEFLVTFLAIFFIAQWGLSYFFPSKFGNTTARPPIELLGQAKVREGHHPVLTLRNNTDRAITLASRCPQPLVDVMYTASDGTESYIIPDQTVLDCSAATPATLPAQSSTQLSMAPWKYSVFGQLGTYTVSLDLQHVDITGLEKNPTFTFTIVPVGTTTKLFRAFVTKPLLNGLIFIASVVPGHDLGLSIILLTLIIKVLLFFPSQHALEGQRKLQELQPKIDAVRKQYKDDPKKQQEETLKLWRAHHVNPFQSCVPLLIQFPVLIGLFFTIRDGAVLATSRHLLYPVYAHLTWTFDTSFLVFDLTQPSHYVFPPLLAVLQFIQMKMALKKRGQKKVVETEKKPRFSIENMDQQTMMAYLLPIMIAAFAFKFPTAVALYWGTSTFFAIGQQWYVNHKKKV